MSLTGLLLGRLQPGLWTIGRFGSEERDRAASFDRTTVETSLSAVDNKDELLASIAQDLGFPPHFGRNWDALVDSLDQWAIDNSGALWVVSHLNHVDATDPAAVQTFVEIAAETFNNPDRGASCLLVGYESDEVADLDHMG